MRLAFDLQAHLFFSFFLLQKTQAAEYPLRLFAFGGEAATKKRLSDLRRHAQIRAFRPSSLVHADKA